MTSTPSTRSAMTAYHQSGTLQRAALMSAATGIDMENQDHRNHALSVATSAVVQALDAGRIKASGADLSALRGLVAMALETVHHGRFAAMHLSQESTQ